jgi:phospholipase C
MTLDRRTFVKGALGASGAMLLGDTGALASGSSGAGASSHAIDVSLPHPAKSGIAHVIVVMMENRSFDHFLGWLPHADGHQAGLSYPDPTGALHRTYHQTQFNGCDFTDPDHSYSGGATSVQRREDGWLPLRQGQ